MNSDHSSKNSRFDPVLARRSGIAAKPDPLFGDASTLFQVKINKYWRENISAINKKRLLEKFIPEFKTLDLISKSQEKSPSGISIIEGFYLPFTGCILFNLASWSCMNIQYSPRQDGCAYSFASRDQPPSMPHFYWPPTVPSISVVNRCTQLVHAVYTVFQQVTHNG